MLPALYWPLVCYISWRAAAVIPSREGAVNSSGSIEFTARTVAETRLLRDSAAR